RPDREVLGTRALRRPPGHRHHRQGPGERLPAVGHRRVPRADEQGMARLPGRHLRRQRRRLRRRARHAGCHPRGRPRRQRGRAGQALAGRRPRRCRQDARDRRRARPRPDGRLGIRHARRRAGRQDLSRRAAARRQEGPAAAHLRGMGPGGPDDPRTGGERRADRRGAEHLAGRRRRGDGVTRYITISLDKRGVNCRAALLDHEAPRTCEAVWNALPQSGQAYHAKYARNEVYTLVKPFADPPPGRENPTVTPIPGDVVYFGFEPWEIGNPAYGYDAGSAAHNAEGATDLATFYGRNNLLLNGDVGWVPGNVFATIVEGLDEMAAA